MKKILLYSIIILSVAFTSLVAESNQVDFKMLPNGEFKVFTNQGEEWIEQGSLSFYQFYQTKNMKLQGIDYAKPIRVKFVKSGGPAAIDFISVAGVIPRGNKIKAMDNVAMLVNDQIEFQFAGAFEDVIVITAKIDA